MFDIVLTPGNHCAKSQDMVFQLADLFHSADDFVTGLQKTRRIEAETNSGRGTGGDNVAGFQRHALGKLGDNSRNIRNQQAGVGLLTQLAIDMAGNIQFQREWQLAFVDNGRPHDRISVQRFAAEPLNVLFLNTAGGHIVENGVAENVIFRFLRLDVAAGFADDDSQFRLVVHAFVQSRMRSDAFVGAGDSAGTFGEVNVLLVFFILQVEKFLGFLLMSAVVDADTENIVNRALNRCQQFYLLQWNGFGQSAVPADP